MDVVEDRHPRPTVSEYNVCYCEEPVGNTDFRCRIYLAISGALDSDRNHRNEHSCKNTGKGFSELAFENLRMDSIWIPYMRMKTMRPFSKFSGGQI